MRIGINLLPYKEITGWVIYIQNLLKELVRLSQNDKFFIFCSENLPLNLRLNEVKNTNLVVIRGLKGKHTKAFYQQFNIYPLLKKYKINLLFSPSPAAPIFYKNKVVVIHDCAYDQYPEFENKLSKMYFRAMFYGAKYFSKKIITVSNFSKKELIELYKISPDKIEVIYEGVPELPEVNENFIQKTLAKFKIDKPYFFYIGNWRPRKNLLGLIKAFKIFREKTNPDWLLIIGGRKDKRFLDLEKEIEKNNLQGKVILTDALSRKEISSLYKKAKSLTFSSFYEGFGLPILEAQSLGIPVLTSNISSLPEVAGNAAFYVNPYNIEEIAKGMEKIAFDESLRQNLIKKGFENIKRFSWEKAAKQLLNLFHSL
ncbi:MAG: glycosyltransferase family 4 protein [Candidatus Nealsonbacteria bacterium]